MEQFIFPRLVCSWRKEKGKEEGKTTRVTDNLENNIRTGEMVRLLRALASLLEDLGSSPRAHMLTYDCL